MNFNDFLRNFVKENYKPKGLTQGDLAGAGGRTTNYFNEWLNNTRGSDLSVSAAYGILLLLGIDLVSLIEREAKQETVGAALSAFFERPLAKRITPEERAALVALDRCGYFSKCDAEDVETTWDLIAAQAAHGRGAKR